MKTLDIGGNTYEIGKMPTRTQFHVQRRVMPILLALGPSLIGALGSMKSGPDATTAEKSGSEADIMTAAMAPLVGSLAEMRDDELDYIINACLAVCNRKVGDKWARVLAPDGVTFMFADMTSSEMMQLTVATIQENLGNFFDLLPGA
jgi:hypothetical protein